MLLPTPARSWCSGGVDRDSRPCYSFDEPVKVFEKKESTLDSKSHCMKITVKRRTSPGTVGSQKKKFPRAASASGLVLDLGDPESETFDLVVFVKTCITYTSTLLTGSGNANEATSY